MAKLKLSRCKQKQQVNREINASILQIEENNKLIEEDLALLEETKSKIAWQMYEDMQRQAEFERKQQIELLSQITNEPNWTEEEYMRIWG